MTINKTEQENNDLDSDKRFDNLFDGWVDEFFSNSSVDLEILRKAFNDLINKNKS